VEESQGKLFWQRFTKTTGLTGGLAFLMVYFAASLNGRFDWSVFFLAGTALFLCWARTWILVPIHACQATAEDEMWNRFFESDWRFVNTVSGLSGAELDELRALFRDGNDTRARGWIKQHWEGMDSAEVQDFMRFFNEEFMDTISAYLDDTGRLQPYD